MSAAGRPWWASDADALDPDIDPLEAHRRARRGAVPSDPSGADDGRYDDGTGTTGPGPERDRTAAGGTSADVDDGGWTALTDALGRLARDLSGPSGDDGSAAGHRIDACGVCPFCLAVRALGESRPELVAHLAEAARQVALAVRAVVDGPQEASRDPGGAAGADPCDRGGRAGRVERIHLDDGPSTDRS